MADLKVWGIQLPDYVFEIRDLHVDVLDGLAAPYGLSYADVIVDPAARAGLLGRIIHAVAEFTDTPLPAVVTGRDVMVALEELLVLVDEDAELDGSEE